MNAKQALLWTKSAEDFNNISEIYVISNRDVDSMQVLDEWLNFVDTDEILPLFEKLPMDYEISKLHATNWDNFSEEVVAVVRDQDFAHLRKLESLAELRTILDLLNDHGEKKMLFDTFSHILTLEANSSLSLDHTQAALNLLDFLPNAAYLIPAFFRSQTWRTHKSVLEDNLVHLAFTLLRQLVLLTQDMGSFIPRPIQILLQG
ncbi:hypothetical protein AA0111_g9493 [Alternaria arborescens]|uniref:hypothetical protein n=1 Tax=Alternaria arborescens TaxID=156630 RepID=UPI0010752AF2|nr:hypothetical protein AA0111_g9493 [Alternaria arborescens]RYO21933.1 hypothetical protein AA0111_g9493 [Alternaria arborescens]